MGSFIASIGTFVGDSGSGGQAGLVPAPSSGDSSKFLKGNGTWAASSGGSSGGGSKNYLSVYTASTASGVANTGNGDFELGTTTGWALGNVALTNNFPSGVPTFGSGASGNLSIAAITSSQLAGTTSMSYVSSAATTAGNFVASSAFFIDLEDQAKALTFSFAYNAFANPLNANWSGTSSNSYGVAIYDVTNSVWIMPAGCFGMTQSSGVGICTGTFQSSSNGTQYRICLYNANATSGAVTTYLDDFKIGPQTAPIGAVITAWQAYPAVPASQGFGTLTNPTQLEWMREGGDCLIRGNFTTGTISAAEGRIGLPTGLTSADTTVIPATQICGVWENNSIGPVSSAFVLIQPSVTYVNFGFRDASNAPLTLQLGSALTGNTTTISMQARVPIQGWGGTVQMSNDTDTRVVAMQVNGTPTATITGSDSLLKFTTTPTADTHGGFSTSTGLYTCPVSGFYRCTANFDFNGTFTGDQGINLSLRKNGTAVNQNGWVASAATGAGFIALVNVTGTIYCNAGDTLSPGVSGAGSSLAVQTSATYNFFHVERLSGPSVVAASETVAMQVSQASPTATITSSYSNVKFTSSPAQDTHAGYSTSTGKYTCPVSGFYRCSASLNVVATYTVGQGVNLAIYKTGSEVFEGIAIAPAMTASSMIGWVFGTIYCNAGDTLELQAKTAGSSVSIGANVFNNYLHIERVK